MKHSGVSALFCVLNLGKKATQTQGSRVLGVFWSAPLASASGWHRSRGRTLNVHNADTFALIHSFSTSAKSADDCARVAESCFKPIERPPFGPQKNKRGREKKGPPPVHRSHREIYTRQNFWMISGAPFLFRPLCFTADFCQCSFVYPYPSVSDLAGGNSDHGPRKTRAKTQTTPNSVLTKERRNSDHGLSFWGGKTQTMV